MLREYLLNNFNELEILVQMLNNYNGSFEHLMVWENDEEFFETFFPDNPMEAVRSAVYGHYNYNDKFVKFNGYGNLESLTEVDYKWLLENNVDDVINELYICKDTNYIDPKILNMLDE